MDWSIAQVRDDDREGLVLFAADVFAELGYTLDLNDRHADFADPASEYLHSGGNFFVLKIDGQIRGTSAVRRIADGIAELKRLYLVREFQGYGFGMKLLRRAIEHASAEGFARMRLDTTSRSPRAIALFERVGFYRIERYNDNANAEFFYEMML